MLKIVFVCDKCFKEHIIICDGGVSQITLPNLPSGWYQSSDNGYVCDKHIITITDNEEEVGT